MSITTLNLGKIRINWRGPFASSTAYTVNDAVSSGGSSYICVTAYTSTSSFATDLAAGYWQLMANGASSNVNPGDITYQGPSGNTNLAIGSAGQVLTVSSSGYPIWSNPNAEGDVFYVSINGNDSNNGTSLNAAFKTLKYACSQVTGPATIFVKAGTYYETLPITVPANVTIVGDGMRDTQIAPLTGSATATYVSGGNTTTIVVSSTSGILAGMTVTGTGYTGKQQVVSVTNSTTLVMSAASNTTPSGTLTFTYLSTDASPVVNNLSTMFYLSDQTMLQGLLLTGMTGFSFNGSYPTDITQATIGGVYLRLNPSSVITKSPYIKDCTAKSTGGVAAIIDGSVQSSGNKSMVFWAYNIVLDSGIGIWCANGGKAEAVSVFTYYCYMGYVASGGGLIRSIAGNNSYGTYGVVSSGYLSTETPVTANVYGGMLTYNTATATGTFTQGETITQATSGATGVVTSVQTGYLYYKSTSGTFNTTNLVTGGTSGATMTPTVVGGQSNYVLVLSSLSGSISAGASIQFATGDTSAYVISAVSTATVNSTSVTIVTLAQQKVTPSTDGTVANIRYNFSLIRLQSHDFLQIGTGGITTTNYPGTPTQGPTPANQITYTYPGRVYYVSTDELGNFYVGNYFSVNQATGSATLNASAFNLSGLTSLRLGSIGAQLGAQINEFSTDGTISQNSDLKVPTQHAVRTYLGAAYQNISPAYDTVVITATASSGNNITVSSTTGLVVGMTAVFGANLGSLTAQTVYYILTASGTTITVALAPGGSAVSVGTTTSQSVAVNCGYSLGDASHRWSHVYVGPGSITLGSITISDVSGTLQVTSSGSNASANINAINNGTSNVTVANNGSVTVVSAGTTAITATSASTTVNNNLIVSGTLTVNGATEYIQGTNTVLTDNLLELHAPTGGFGGTWSSSDGKDIGLRMHYYASGADQNAALLLANDTGYLEWYNTGTENGSGDFVSATYGTIKAATFLATTSIASSSTTFNLVNTTATTLNIGGAATTVSLGASTGTTTVNNALSVTGHVTLEGTTSTGSTGSGAIVFGTSPAITTSLTTPSTTFALANTTATTINEFGAATTINVASNAASATTLYLGANTNNNILSILGNGTTGTASLTSNITNGTTNLFVGNGGTVYIGGAGSGVQIGTSSGNSTLQIQGNGTSGTATLTTNVTTGTVNMFTGANNVNIASGSGAVSLQGSTVVLTNNSGPLQFYFKVIATQGTPNLGTNKGYILLAKAYISNGNQSLSIVDGTFTLIRGSTGSGNRNDTYQVVSQSAYGSERLQVSVYQDTGSPFYTRLCKVTYSGVVYHAIETTVSGGNPDNGITFTGNYANTTPVYCDTTYVTSTISTTGTVGSITGTGPWTATITGMSSTSGLSVGSTITATAGTGTLYGGSPTSVIVASIVSGTSITYTVTGGTTPTAGTITNVTTAPSISTFGSAYVYDSSGTTTFPNITAGSVTSTGTGSFTSYVTMGSLVANDPGSNYYSYTQRLGGTVGISQGVSIGQGSNSYTAPPTNGLLVYGPLFGQLYSSSGATINLTGITAGSFVCLEVIGYANPNSGGANYVHPIHAYVYCATGYNGSAVSYYIYTQHVAPPAASVSAGQAYSANEMDAFFYNGTTSATTVTTGASGYYVQLQIYNYNATYGSGFNVRVTQRY